MLMRNRILWIGLLLVAVNVEASDLASFERRHEQSLATDEGKIYEKKAIRAFWGDAAFMQECAPADAPIAKSLVIFFQVLADGSLGEIQITPETEVAACIAEAVADRRFPQPSHDFVAKIELEFAE